MAQVRCPGCDRSVKLTAQNAVKKVKCTCGQVFVMPALPRPTQPAAQAAPIKFNCPSCATLLQVAASFAGQQSVCPCGAQFTVPPFSIPATAWTGIIMILAGALWLFVGMFTGWIYYAPIGIIVMGVCIAVFGALFGDVAADDWDD